MSVVLRILLVTLLFSCPAYAAFSSQEDYILPVASAGAGGLGVANTWIGDAMLQNPAGLAVTQKGTLSSFAGNVGGRAAGVGGLSLSYPIDPSLAVGLAWNNFNEWEFGSYGEQSLSGAAAFRLNQIVSAGVKAVFHQLSSPGLSGAVQGSSVDVGWHSDLGDWLDLNNS